jgi:MoxR-like ATPase
VSDTVLIAGIEVPVADTPAEWLHLVPDDEEYEPQGDEFRALAVANVTHKHVALVGPTGTGKNAVIRKFCHLTNRPLITLSMAEGTGIDQLIGSVQPAGDGQGGLTTEWYDGALPFALRIGACLGLDEGNAADPRLTMRVHDFAAYGDKLFIFENPRAAGTYMSPYNEAGEHNGFFMVLTLNPSDDGHYAGTQEMNAAFRDRLIHVEMDYLGLYDIDSEASVVSVKTGTDIVFCRRVIKVLNQVRKQTRLSDKEIAAGGQPIYATASVRRAIDVAEFTKYMPIMTAWELGYLNGLNREDRPIVAKLVLDEFAGE